MTTGKIKIDPYATGHPLHEGTSYIPVNFQKSNDQPGGKLKPLVYTFIRVHVYKNYH